MMDLLLIHCEAGTSPLELVDYLPPLGLVELASFLKRHGFDVGVIDARHHDFTIDQLADLLAEERPRWVGIDVLADTVFTAARLVNIVRKSSPSTRIMVGGPQASIVSEDVLLHLEPDVVVRGEGEISCAEILSGKELPDVRGIVFKDGEKIVRTPPQPLIDLDDLPPPDFGLLRNHDTMNFFPSVHTGRGCPYKCTFCAAPVLGPKVRWRSIDKVMEDIQAAFRAFPKKYLVITDDTFTFDKRRIHAFCKAMRRIGGGTDLFWYAEGRVDRLAGDRALMRAMKEAGLVMLQLGIESGDESVLKAYKKNIRLDDVRWVCKALADEGILVHGGFIDGGPFESRETLARTEGFMKELIELGRGLMQAKSCFLNPLPGTDIYEHPDRYGLKLLDPELLTSVSFDNAVTSTDFLSREEIFRGHLAIMASTVPLQKEIFDREANAHRDYLTDLRSKVGAIHLSLSFLDDASFEDRARNLYDMMMRKAVKHRQFFTSGYEHGIGLIPARLPFFNIDARGNYFNNLLKQGLTDAESDVLHYACGKLTGGEIGIILEMDDDSMKAALRGLEEKKMIIYRTY